MNRDELMRRCYDPELIEKALELSLTDKLGAGEILNKLITEAIADIEAEELSQQQTEEFERKQLLMEV